MKLTQLFVVFFLLLALPSFAATQQEDDNAARGVETSVANPQVAAPAAESGGNQPLPNPKNSKSDDDRSKQVLSLFTWFTDVESPDWITGVIYALLGLEGALITVFGLIGGAIPGTAVFARIEAGMKRVEEREKIIDKLIKDSKRNPEAIKAVEVATNNLRDDLRENRRRQFRLAAGLKAV